MTFENLLVIVLIIILLFLFKDKIFSLLSGRSVRKKEEKEEEKGTYTTAPRTKKTEAVVPKEKPKAKKRPVKEDSAAPRIDDYTKAKDEIPGKPRPAAEPEALEKKPETATKPEKPIPAKVIPDTIPKPFPEPTVAKDFPPTSYPKFDNSRLLDMGLSQEDAKAFTVELIKQFDEQLPQIETALQKEDYENIEHLTHSIKGSSSNLGSGGVAAVVTDFNTYVKTGKDREIISAHMNNMKKYLHELKEEFQ